MCLGLGIPNMRVGRVSVKFARRAGWLRKGAMELNPRIRCGKATLFIGFFTHLFFETVPEAPKGYRWAVKRTVVNFDRNAFRAVN